MKSVNFVDKKTRSLYTKYIRDVIIFLNLIEKEKII